MLSPIQIEFLEQSIPQICSGCGVELVCPECDPDAVEEMARDAAVTYAEDKRDAYD